MTDTYGVDLVIWGLLPGGTLGLGFLSFIKGVLQ